jgi:hypothetical protein
MGTGEYTLFEVSDCAGSVVWKREEWKMEERKKGGMEEVLTSHI